MRLKKAHNRIEGECSAFKCAQSSEIVHTDGSKDDDRLEFCEKHWEKFCSEDGAPKPITKPKTKKERLSKKERKQKSTSDW